MTTGSRRLFISLHPLSLSIMLLSVLSCQSRHAKRSLRGTPSLLPCFVAPPSVHFQPQIHKISNKHPFCQPLQDNAATTTKQRPKPEPSSSHARVHNNRQHHWSSSRSKLNFSRQRNYGSLVESTRTTPK